MSVSEHDSKRDARKSMLRTRENDETIHDLRFSARGQGWKYDARFPRARWPIRWGGCFCVDSEGGGWVMHELSSILVRWDCFTQSSIETKDKRSWTISKNSAIPRKVISISCRHSGKSSRSRFVTGMFIRGRGLVLATATRIILVEFANLEDTEE